MSRRGVHVRRAVVRLLPVLAVLVANDTIGYYNLAGAQALLGQHEEAIAALTRDLEPGDTDWAYLEADPWFERLRADPRFAAIVARMKRAAG